MAELARAQHAGDGEPAQSQRCSGPMPLLTGERGDQEDNRRREDQRDLREDVSDRHFSLLRPAPPLPIRQPTAAKSDRRQWRPLESAAPRAPKRSEENTSELQSLMRNSYAVFCLKKKTKKLP